MTRHAASPAAISAFDRHMMAIALGMAARGLGRTAPNPSVGAVIADEARGVVLSRATTADGGRPHAEPLAIAAAGVAGRGQTLYVTLEPCSHVGRTGPCADAIIAAGLQRVVVAIEDPDPRVAGRGIERLRAAGIEVARGTGAAEARWLTRGHIVRVTERRPFVTLKLALRADGSVAHGTGDEPVFVTGPQARAHGHLLRAEHDAILVGEGTVRDDDPLLTCRLPGMATRSPVRVMLSRYLNERPDSRLAKTSREVPFWIYCSQAADPVKRRQREDLGATVEAVPVVGERLWLPAVMEALVARGITRLLVEGGPSVWRSFADAALVDEVVLFAAGKPGAGLVAEAAVRSMLGRALGPVRLTLDDMRVLGSDTMWRFRHAPIDGKVEPCLPD